MTNRRVASGGARRVVLGAALAAGWLGVVLMAPSAGVAAPAGGPPAIGNCPIFPADNVWNARIDHLPVHARSDAWIASIGASTGLHPDFGSGIDNGAPIGIPYSTAPGSQPEVEITFDVRRRERPRPVPPPVQCQHRGWRPPRPDRRPRALPADGDLRRRREASPTSGPPAPVRSSTCTRTTCVRLAGPRRTRPACRSCRAWRATTRSKRERSRTRCASRSSGPRRRTSGRRGTTHPRTRTRTSRRWARGSG